MQTRLAKMWVPANRSCSHCCQTSPYYLYDALVDVINGAIAVDRDHTQRFTGGNLLVLVEDPAVEHGALRFEPVFIATGGRECALVAAARTLERAIEIGQQQQGQVRLQTVAQGCVQDAHYLAAQLPSTALIGFAGVGKGVTQTDGPG